VRLRPFAGPAAFLLAATLAVAGIRALTHHAPAAPARTQARPAAHRPATQPARRVYVVRAGDTLAAVAARTGVPASRLLRLNPSLQPTALFLGQRIRLR